jgi:hypothetical protein
MEEPDAPMTPEEEAIAALLSPEVLAQIDAALLSFAAARRRKVARLVGSVMLNSNACVVGLPDVFYAQRIRSLVHRGLLVAYGNLDYMRYSEVCLPGPDA